MKVFYAHPSSLYGSSEEMKAIALLKSHRYQVVNPGALEHQEKLEQVCASRAGKEEKAKAAEGYFKDLCDGCSVLAFSTFADRSLGADVAKQVQSFIDRGAPVFQVTDLFGMMVLSNVQSLDGYKCLDAAETKEALIKASPAAKSLAGKRNKQNAYNLG